MWAITLQVLQPIVRQVPLPSGHPVVAKRSWSHHSARKVFHISATRNIERADGKYMKNCKEKRRMLEPRRIRTIERKIRMILIIQRASCRVLVDHPSTSICKPLLPPSHATSCRSGKLGGHTSPQSSWSRKNSNHMRKKVQLRGEKKMQSSLTP